MIKVVISGNLADTKKPEERERQCAPEHAFIVPSIIRTN